MNKDPRPFDPTVSFMFFGTWVQAIEGIKQVDTELAYRMFKAIADYCMYDEDPDFSDQQYLNAMWPLVANEAESSIKRRKSQFEKDELNENYKKIIEAACSNPELSHRGIAELVGVSPSMVDRVFRKYGDRIPAVPSAGDCDTSPFNSDAHPLTSHCDSDNVSFPFGYSDSGIDRVVCCVADSDSVDVTMMQGSDAGAEIDIGDLTEEDIYIEYQDYLKELGEEARIMKYEGKTYEQVLDEKYLRYDDDELPF